MKPTDKPAAITDKLFAEFVCESGKMHTVSLKTLHAPWDAGGLDMPCINTLTEASRLRWVAMFLDPAAGECGWYQLARYLIRLVSKSVPELDTFKMPKVTLHGGHDPVNHLWTDNINAAQKAGLKHLPVSPVAFTSTPVAALSPATSRLSVAIKDSESMLRLTGTVPDGAAQPEPDTPVEECQDGSSDGGSGDDGDGDDNGNNEKGPKCTKRPSSRIDTPQSLQ